MENLDKPIDIVDGAELEAVLNFADLIDISVAAKMEGEDIKALVESRLDQLTLKAFLSGYRYRINKENDQCNP